MRKRQSLLARILLAVVLIGGIGYIVLPLVNERRGSSEDLSTATENVAPGFVKGGEVVFYKNGNKIIKIDVEIAADNVQRAKGLMYRPSMPDSVGMLFVFDQSEPQAFWMKNTMIPLDIIYVGSNKKIVSIQKNAVPYSEASLPSQGDAQYVVEVNAGFSDRYDLQPGDVISF
jgi:uncharacterized membrane protein (UPF0127 family)